MTEYRIMNEYQHAYESGVDWQISGWVHDVEMVLANQNQSLEKEGLSFFFIDRDGDRQEINSNHVCYSDDNWETCYSYEDSCCELPTNKAKYRLKTEEELRKEFGINWHIDANPKYEFLKHSGTLKHLGKPLINRISEEAISLRANAASCHYPMLRNGLMISKHFIIENDSSGSLNLDTSSAKSNINFSKLLNRNIPKLNMNF